MVSGVLVAGVGQLWWAYIVGKGLHSCGQGCAVWVQTMALAGCLPRRGSDFGGGVGAGVGFVGQYFVGAG